MNKNKTIKGISILDSLVCIVIIGIGFIAIMHLSAFSIGSMDRAIEKNKVNFLTEMMMEDVVADPDQIKEYSKFKESVFVKQIDQFSAANLQEKLYQYPGFFLRTITMRKYPYKAGAHVLGYMGEVDVKKTKEDKYYIKGDFAGVSGIEAGYEKYLRITIGPKKQIQRVITILQKLIK